MNKPLTALEVHANILAAEEHKHDEPEIYYQPDPNDASMWEAFEKLRVVRNEITREYLNNLRQKRQMVPALVQVIIIYSNIFRMHEETSRVTGELLLNRPKANLEKLSQFCQQLILADQFELTKLKDFMSQSSLLLGQEYEGTDAEKSIQQFILAGVEASNSPNTWESFTLKQLQSTFQMAKKAQKYLFIWDQQGSVGTFMQYKGMLAELAHKTVQVSLGRQTNADVAEYIRDNFVRGMRIGACLCYDLENTQPNFKNFNVENTFDTADFFNHYKMACKDTYIKYVREDENYLPNGTGQGLFFRQEDFLMIIRSGVETEAEVQAVIAGIPQFETEFVHCIIK